MTTRLKIQHCCKRCGAFYEREPGQHAVPKHCRPCIDAGRDRHTKDPDRVATIVARVHAGENFATIARSYGLSRERIRQLGERGGVTGADAAAVHFAARKAAAFQNRNERLLHGEENRARLLMKLRALFAELGHPPTVLEAGFAGIWPATLVKYFGSRLDAYKVAGITDRPLPTGRRSKGHRQPIVPRITANLRPVSETGKEPPK